MYHVQLYTSDNVVLYCITINFVLLRPAEMHALTNKENVMSQNTVYAIA